MRAACFALMSSSASAAACPKTGVSDGRLHWRPVRRAFPLSGPQARRTLTHGAISSPDRGCPLANATYLEMTMEVSLPFVPPNPLASIIAEHEDAPPLSESELYRVRAAELRQEGEQTSWPEVRER